jgi:tetratricopeptide (TPR) repeat protein
MESGRFTGLGAEVHSLMSRGEFDRALRLVEDGIRQNPGDGYLYALLAEVSESVAIDRAIEAYRRGLDYNPDNRHLNLGLGFLFYRNKDFRNAEKYLLRAWIEDPTNVRLLTVLGKIFNSYRQFEKAIKYFELAELIDPNNTYAIYGLANSYRGVRDNDRALKYWLKFHELEPRNKIAITRIGDCYSVTGDFEKALSYYGEALSIGYDFYALVGSARVYTKLKQYEKALEIYQSMASKEKGNYRYHNELVSFWEAAGDKKQADKLRALAPSSKTR